MRILFFVLFSVFSVYFLFTNDKNNSYSHVPKLKSSNFLSSQKQGSQKIVSQVNKFYTEMIISHIPQLIILLIGFILMLYIFLLDLCKHVTYLPYNTNLTISRYRIRTPLKLNIFLLLGTITILITTEHPEFLYNFIPNICYILFRFTLILTRLNHKNIQSFLFISLTLYIFDIAYEPVSQTFCLLILQIFSNRFLRITSWLPGLLIILANDIHVNPGPQYQNTFFTFMSWNVNSLAKNDFQWVQLIEAHNYL